MQLDIRSDHNIVVIDSTVFEEHGFSFFCCCDDLVNSKHTSIRARLDGVALPRMCVTLLSSSCRNDDEVRPFVRILL